MEDITLLTGIALVALGLAAATYGVMVGSGGGFIVSPLLILFFRLDHDLAVGTSLIAVFLASVSGGISYFRLKRVDLRSALLFSLVAIPGALLGVLAVEVVAGSSFKIIFGVLLSLLGIFIFVRPIPSSERSAGRLLSEFRQEPVPVAAKRPPGMATRRIITTEGRVYQYTFLEPAAVAVNLVFGFLSGFFGIGGGPIRSPTLVYVFRFPVAIATATSVFTQSIYTGVGSIGHIVSGNILIPTALLVGVGMVAGAQIAVPLSRIVQGVWIMRLLSLAMVIIGVQLILDGFFD